MHKYTIRVYSFVDVSRAIIGIDSIYAHRSISYLYIGHDFNYRIRIIKLVYHQVILDKKLNFVLLDNQVF